MTDKSSQDEERERLSWEEDAQRREDKERRSSDLQEAWRRNHPSEQEGREGPGQRRGIRLERTHIDAEGARRLKEVASC